MIGLIFLVVIMLTIGSALNYFGITIAISAFELIGGSAIGTFLGGAFATLFGIFIIPMAAQVIHIIIDLKE